MSQDFIATLQILYFWCSTGFYTISDWSVILDVLVLDNSAMISDATPNGTKTGFNNTPYPYKTLQGFRD